MPNIPPNFIIVIDNAPYHNFQLNQAPNSNSLKGDMVKWLRERNITFTDTMLKPELYELIKLYKPQYKTYKIDTILAEQGHSVLRLPPYHPYLNPTEMIWSILKERVVKWNPSFSITAVQELVQTICSEITSEDWTACVNHCKQAEESYMALEPQIDLVSEQIVVNLGADSDSDMSESG